METKIRLLPLREAQAVAFKEEMQEAFQHGFDFQSSLLTLGRADTSIVLPSLNRSLQSCYKDDNQWQVLPDKDFYQSLETEGAEAYEAIDEDGQRLGGAIIAIDAPNHHGELAPDPNMPEQFDQEDGLFKFEKRMKEI